MLAASRWKGGMRASDELAPLSRPEQYGYARSHLPTHLARQRTNGFYLIWAPLLNLFSPSSGPSKIEMISPVFADIMLPSLS
jgi:hypothetical protein